MSKSVILPRRSILNVYNNWVTVGIQISPTYGSIPNFLVSSQNVSKQQLIIIIHQWRDSHCLVPPGFWLKPSFPFWSSKRTTFYSLFHSVWFFLCTRIRWIYEKQCKPSFTCNCKWSSLIVINPSQDPVWNMNSRPLHTLPKPTLPHVCRYVSSIAT